MNASDIKMIKALALDYVEGERGLRHEKEVARKVSISFEARFGKDAPEAVFDDPKSRRKVMEAAFSLMKAGMTDVVDMDDDHALPALPPPGEIIRDVDAEEVA